MQFHTATINSWQHLLKDDLFKEEIISCLQWLDENNRARIHGFVIMPNHIHLLWTILDSTAQPPAQTLASFTAHQFKRKLMSERTELLEYYLSTQNDRDYHFWERRPLSKDIFNRDMALQKLEYIHNNPLQEHWKLVIRPEDYSYSSASFYVNGETRFQFLKHVIEYW